MSYYHQYEFVSPEPLYAIIKEELKSYFDTGAVDDLLFPTYTDKCLRKLGRATYKISEDVLFVEGYQARLPDNFYAMREAWLCLESDTDTMQASSSFYSQAASSITIQISPIVTDEASICHAVDCMPEIAMEVYKTTKEAEFYKNYARHILLKPGNISTRANCGVDYCDYITNSGVSVSQHTPYSSAYDSFDVRGNKFTVKFSSGVVYILYYSTDVDCVGNQMVPDNYRIREYIEAFIKYKIFETLLNQTNDETFNQLEKKMVYYKQLADETYIMAEVEIKKQTAWEKQRRIKQTLNRHNIYELPNGTNRMRNS